jgi:hypothetical protein
VGEKDHCLEEIASSKVEPGRKASFACVQSRIAFMILEYNDLGIPILDI